MMKNNQFLKFFLKRVAPLVGMLLFLCNLSGVAQTRTIAGRVISDSGVAVSGASVRVKGSTNGTVTSADGSFSITANPNDILEISEIGYATESIKAGSGKSLSVRLSKATSALNEVVVVGYGTVKRKDLTGSISSLTSSIIEQTPVVDVQQALQGRAAGVQIINNDGAPGSSVTVLIRGTGSLASNGNVPLYVVDGYPMTGGINNINPNDIASVDVLKDASATAIYGVRAANGVVIVTTKRGKTGAAQVSLDAYWAVQSKPKRYDILNARDWATLANQVADADSGHNFIEMPIWRSPDSLHNIDWQNAVYGQGLTQSYSLGIRAGGDKVQSAMSVGYFDQKGIVEGSYFKRLTLGANLTYTPIKWLRSNTNAYYAYQNSNNPFGTGSLIQLAQLPPTMDGGNMNTPYVKEGSDYGFYNPNETYVAKYNNPVYTIESQQASNITNWFLANSSLEVTLLDGLKVKTMAGVNTTNYSGSYFTPENDVAHEQYPSAIPANAFYSQHLSNIFEWVWENTISYDKSFGLHTINFVGGVSAQKTTTNLMGGSGIPPNSIIRDLAQVSNLKLDANGNGQTIATLESQFARLSYNYAEKYFITGTLRRDGSSKFDEGHQYGIFPSGAVAWRIKEEDFMKNVDWLSDLKVRGSYGEVGNQSSIGLFQYQALFTTGYPANFADGVNSNLGYPFNKLYQRGYAQSQPANPDLRWETDYMTDIGLDAALLNGALSVTVDWFNRKSKDFLLPLAAPAQTGYNTLTRNVGSMNNKGWEFAVNYNNNKGRDFHWNINANISVIKNTLTSLTSGANYITNFGGTTSNPTQNFVPTGIGWSNFSQTYIGQPVGEFYGFKTLGIFQSQAQINQLNAEATQKNPANLYYQKPTNTPGDRYFADVNGDGIVDANDRVSLGSPQPDFYGGLTFNGSYKNWDFSVFFYGVYGNKIDNYVESSLESFQNRGFTGVQNVSKDYYINHWTPQNPSNRYAKATYNDDAIGSNAPSSTWIENGSYLKLKNLSIGYTLPGSLSKRASMSKVRIYVSTQNLFTITSYTGPDPEIGAQNGNATQAGVDNGIYPSSRYFTAGINVTF